MKHVLDFCDSFVSCYRDDMALIQIEFFSIFFHVTGTSEDTSPSIMTLYDMSVKML